MLEEPNIPLVGNIGEISDGELGLAFPDDVPDLPKARDSVMERSGRNGRLYIKKVDEIFDEWSGRGCFSEWFGTSRPQKSLTAASQGFNFSMSIR